MRPTHGGIGNHRRSDHDTFDLMISPRMANLHSSGAGAESSLGSRMSNALNMCTTKEQQLPSRIRVHCSLFFHTHATLQRTVTLNSHCFPAHQGRSFLSGYCRIRGLGLGGCRPRRHGDNMESATRNGVSHKTGLRYLSGTRSSSSVQTLAGVIANGTDPTTSNGHDIRPLVDTSDCPGYTELILHAVTFTYESSQYPIPTMLWFTYMDFEATL